jgi:dephospho-CoA kinase
MRDKITPEEAAKTLNAQMETWDKAMRADHVIDNRYGWLYTRSQVIHLAGLLNL